MKHLFVPIEVARQLKEKEFDEECLAVYDMHDEFHLVSDFDPRVTTMCNKGARNNRECTAPLYQQVIDWLREKGVKIIEDEMFVRVDLNQLWSIKEIGGRKSGPYTRDKAIIESLNLINLTQ